MDPYIILAKKTVETYIREGKIIQPPPTLPQEILTRRAGVFVSLHKILPAPIFPIGGQAFIPSFSKEGPRSSLHPSEIYDGYQPPLTKEELRGCIGTLKPVQKNLAQEIIHNAIDSATRDPRFPPVTKGELPHLRYSVDILLSLETVTETKDLDPKRYGLIVSTQDGRQGLLLPDLPGVETVAQQIAICRQKAGILPAEPITLKRFTVERHRE